MPERINPAMPVVLLASASPRRRELLRQIGIEAIVHPANIDETPVAGESVEALVVRLARHKARAVDGSEIAGHPGMEAADVVIVAADTLIEAGGRILGKPRHRTEAVELLCSLQCAAHRVVSGVCVRRAGAEQAMTVSTTVHMGAIDADLADAYWDTGEPADKAGGYAIQGRAAAFITAIEGSYSNVVGLPLHETAAMLAAAGVPVLAAGTCKPNR